MKSIVIIPNPNKDPDLSLTRRLVGKLRSLNFSVYIDESLKDIEGCISYSEFPSSAELVVVVGGDGSVIDASRYAIDRDIPIVGVNLGKVGYLTEIEPDSLDSFDKLISGEYTIEEKILLSVEVNGGEGQILSERLAVNDVVISHNSFLGMCDFSLRNRNGDFVKYRADGVIVATPEGSTAYSLSAGGPIVSHNLDAIVVTPVCPHSFFNRSIIFKSDERITVSNLGEELLNICTDGRLYTEIKKGESCTVFSSDKKLKMLTFAKDNMFSTLFKKMRIMEDVK